MKSALVRLIAGLYERSLRNGVRNHRIIAGPNANLYIALSPIHGRGVFSLKPIQSGSIIEKCPVIKVKLEEVFIKQYMVLNYYTFMIDKEQGYAGLALGYGSIYNHSETHNAAFYYDSSQELLIFEAIRDIPEHDEITINYLGDNADSGGFEFWTEKPSI